MLLWSPCPLENARRHAVSQWSSGVPEKEKLPGVWVWDLKVWRQELGLWAVGSKLAIQSGSVARASCLNPGLRMSPPCLNQET